MRRILKSLVLATAALGLAGCYTCDVCDDCGEDLLDAHYGVYKRGYPNCSDRPVIRPVPAESSPDAETAAVPTTEKR